MCIYIYIYIYIYIHAFLSLCMHFCLQPVKGKFSVSFNTTEMYVHRKLEKRSCNNCCSRKAKYDIPGCVFVALGIQHEMRMRHICGMAGSTIILHIAS